MGGRGRGPRRGRARPHARAGAVLVAVALLGASCSSGDGGDGVSPSTTEAPSIDGTLPPEDGAPATGGELRVAVPRTVADWNPLSASWTPSTRFVASAVYEPLLRIGEAGAPEPWLAESVVPDDDGTTWTITLREGVTFSDGGPLTAAAVKTNLDERADSPAWEAAFDPMGLVSELDGRTLEVSMNRPWYGFDELLTGPAGWMAAPSSFLDPDGDPVDGPVTQPMGTGPFAVPPAGAPLPPEGSTALVRNDGYWGGSVPLDAVEVRSIPDAKERGDALVEGDADLVLVSDRNGLVRFLGGSGAVQVEDLGATESLVELNTAAPPFDDPDLRRAAVLATDRAALADLFTAGLGEPAVGPWIGGQPWFDADTGVPAPDRDAARELVERAGGGEPVAARLLVEPTVEEVQFGQAVARQWEAVGFDVELVTTSPDALAVARARGEFEAAAVHGYDVLTPDHLVGLWSDDGAAAVGEVASNTTRVTSDDLEAALDDLRDGADQAARAGAAGAAVRAFNAESPVVWVHHDIWALVANERVGGLPTAERLGFARTDAAPSWSQLWLRP